MNWSITWYELAAIVGALAWLPQIITWIRAAILKPSVTFVLDRTAQVGFTVYGPIFNVNLAINSENKGIIIHGLQIEIVHQDGDSHIFDWQGVVQQMGTISAEEGRKLPFEKEQNAIAIKIAAGALEDRFVRFQDRAFLQKQQDCLQKAIDRMNTLQKANPNYHDELLASDEVQKHIEIIKHANIWKPGEYKCRIKANSTTPFNVHDDTFTFVFSVADVESLQSNANIINFDIENQIKANLPEYKPHGFAWQWRSPLLVRPKEIEQGQH